MKLHISETRHDSLIICHYTKLVNHNMNCPLRNKFIGFPCTPHYPRVLLSIPVCSPCALCVLLIITACSPCAPPYLRVLSVCSALSPYVLRVLRIISVCFPSTPHYPRVHSVCSAFSPCALRVLLIVCREEDKIYYIYDLYIVRINGITVVLFVFIFS